MLKTLMVVIKWCSLFSILNTLRRWWCPFPVSKTFKSRKKVMESFFAINNFKSRKKLIKSFFSVLKTLFNIKIFKSRKKVMKSFSSLNNFKRCDENIYIYIYIYIYKHVFFLLLDYLIWLIYVKKHEERFTFDYQFNYWSERNGYFWWTLTIK